jgi:hypothetical protein
METMKVYIKPWIEALKEAKKHEGFVNFFPDHAKILGVSRRIGDWGHICTVTKNSDDEYTSYTVVHSRSKDIGFSYDACCVKEITPDWLEEHAEVFAKDWYKVDMACEPTDWDFNTHFNIIYKVKDALNTYFFYVHKFYEHGCGDPVITDFREIN